MKTNSKLLSMTLATASLLMGSAVSYTHLTLPTIVGV